MSELKVELDPGEAGFDGERLARIDRHFARYVDDGRLPGWLLTVSRGGKLVHVASNGRRDREADLPVTGDTLWRWFSMTKPVTSVAAMMLYEEGRLALTDPVAKYIPSFADVRVITGGSDQRPVTVPAIEPVRVWHLLTHTSGLTYGFHRTHTADAIYRARGFEWGQPKGYDLADCCDAFAAMPLAFQPGSEWNYSVSTDVLGRVVEVVSGMALDAFFAERIFGPLQMTGTGFHIAEADAERMAALYVAGPGGTAVRNEQAVPQTRRPRYLSGGGGLVGPAADYHRFTQMLLDRPGSPAGELDGARVLGSRTVRYMTRNHLPGGADLEHFGRRLHAESPFDGVGFGLGFSVVLDAAAGKSLGSEGEYAWGGAASTAFWADPAEELTATFFTQLMPSNTYPIRPEFRQLVYQALID